MKPRSLATPHSIDDLLERASKLRNRTIDEIAGWLGTTAPDDLRRAKGFTGRLVEAALGAHGRDGPDLPDLGVELKTVPLDPRGRPRESTWVCRVPPTPERRWEVSAVRRKLARVLWVPVDGTGPPRDRRFGTPILWTPSPGEEACLQGDWESLVEALLEGLPVDARMGHALQIRPKAASSRDRAWTVDADGEWARDVPRGFYLRRWFTAEILQNAGSGSPARGDDRGSTDDGT